MTLKQDYKTVLTALEEFENDMNGQLPLSKAALVVLISIDKHLKAIEGKI